MPARYALVLLLLALFGAAPAHADGTVYRADGCGDYLFVQTTTGISVLRGDTEGIKEGDALQGNVEQIGMVDLFDQTAGRAVFAQVSQIHLTQADAVPLVSVRCRSPLTEATTSGYVSRASDCGSKIFVNTPQGYAVLERIAGGEVADGDSLTGNFNRPGRSTMHDNQSNSDVIVFVDDLWLSASAAQRKIAQSCQKQSSYGR